MTHPMLTGLVILAACGVLALLGTARRAARHTAWRLADAGRTTGDLARTLVLAGVLTGIEWVCVTRLHGWGLLLTLALPSSVASWTLTHRRLRGGVVVMGRRWRR